MAIRKDSKTDTGERDVRASRRAVGVNVVISVATATALLIVVNVIGDMVSQKNNLRWNVETLGRYRLSEAGKRILDQVDQPIRLTSVYTSTRSDRKPEQYLPRLRDLMEEMAQWKRDVTTVNVTSDRGKSEVVARLRERLDEDAEEYRALIKDFQTLVRVQQTQFEREVLAWRSYPATGWLSRFGLPKAIETNLNEHKEQLRKLATALRQHLSGSGLPDYPGLVDQIRERLDKVHETLTAIRDQLRDLAGLPERAKQAQDELTETVKAVSAELDKAIAVAGKKGSPAPTDPSDVLEKIATTAQATAAQAEKAARRMVKLDTDAGNKLQNLQPWRQGAVLLSQLAQESNNLAAQAQGVRAAVVEQVQRQFITTQLRPALLLLSERAQQAQAAVAEMLAALTELDENTQKRFEQAKRGDFLQAQLEPIRKQLDRAAELEELEGWDELIEKIKEDNNVLVEVGSKVGVVGFDEVWPLAPRGQFDFYADEEEQERRVFYGDMAICGKILNLASDPFADVVLTYFEDVPPPYARQYRPAVTGQIPSRFLQILRERLEKANLEVSDWNLAKDTAPPPATEGRPQVLLVLPSPDMPPFAAGQQNLPKFEQEHVDRVKEVIAQGSAAIFLAGYFRPRFFGQVTSPEYGWGKYLRNEWGLDVKTHLRVVLGARDPTEPDKFVLPVLRWDFLPLSSFTEDHPVGKPLRARRFYWLSACPITRATDGKADVRIEDILVVPREREDIWAAARPEQLWDRIVTGRGTGIVPGENSGDLRAPFALAVEASKADGDGQSRIIVLGVGLSYIDGFLNYRIPQLRGQETLSTEPPPTGDVDLVINSVYHLAGKDQFIGAGPAIIKPIGLIDEPTMRAVKATFGVVWPAMMLVIGGIVMLARKR